MPKILLQTKLYVPRLRPSLIPRPHLIEKLNTGLGGKLTLISAPAGFGKTTLVSEWIAGGERPFTWLSLDERDSDLTRFLPYLIAALQIVTPSLGKRALGMLESPQPASTESVLTTLLNEIAAIPEEFALVLDDYHVVDTQPIDQALTFLLEHLPPQMHLVITTRQDPGLPLARLRVRGLLTELRAADLRFTVAETAEFLNQAMRLNISAKNIAMLEARTEGWIAGLQLAALAMQGQQDTRDFIQSFTGTHRFILDYLLEEVLQKQPEHIQKFLLRTSILNRLCAPLCDALLQEKDIISQDILESLERSNLFINALDGERRWYCYHHLFGDLLRQRLGQELMPEEIVSYHIRASEWYEKNGDDAEAFHHAACTNDLARVERLIVGKGVPLHFRGAVVPVLNWLAAQPTAALDARPTLWVMYASALSVMGRLSAVESKLQAAETALPNIPDKEKAHNLIGHIAAIRALLAASRNQPDEIIAQSQKALEYLHPGNLAVRTATIWKMGIAFQFQEKWAEASKAYEEAVAISEQTGNFVTQVAALIGLGAVQEADKQSRVAEETYQCVLNLLGDNLFPSACLAHLGLARISYARNDLEAAYGYSQQSVALAYQSGNREWLADCEAFLADLEKEQKGVAQALIEPLSRREMEVLRLIAEGRSNAEISQHLHLALSTVKGHNLRIFSKLQVQNRTEAVARARELGIL